MQTQSERVSRLDTGQYVCTDAICIPLAEPAGIFCVSDHRLLVVDTNNHRVVEYDLLNKKSVTWSPSPRSVDDRQLGFGEYPAC